MDLISIFLLSLIEGVTEFLPVSSTAHLSISAQILGIPSSQNLSTFIIAIQLGALVAGAIFILKTIKITNRVLINSVIAFIPTAVIGFIAYPYVKNILFGNMLIIGMALLIGGIVILFVDSKKNALSESKIFGHRLSAGEAGVGSPDATELLSSSTSLATELSYKNAFILGCVQTLAFVPGVSRSGALIIGGGLLKYSRGSIVIFTFLLGLPTLAAATFYDLYKSRDILTFALGQEILIGAILSGVIAYVVARWFLQYVTHHTFKIFGWYRIFAGITVLIFFI